MSNVRKIRNFGWQTLDARALLDAAPDVIFFIDQEGQIIWCNVAATRELGRPRNWICEHNIEDLVSEINSEFDEEGLVGGLDVMQLLRDGVLGDVLVHLPKAGGGVVPVLLSLSRSEIEIDGSPQAIGVCIGKNVSGMLALEQTRLDHNLIR